MSFRGTGYSWALVTLPDTGRGSPFAVAAAWHGQHLMRNGYTRNQLHRRLQRLCLSLTSSHFPSFLVSPQTEWQWIKKEYPYSYTTASASSTCFITLVLPFLCIATKYTKCNTKGRKSEVCSH